MSMREKLNLPKDKVVLVYAGQFVDRKDQKFLLELFRENENLKNYLLVLLGDGADYAGLKERFGGQANVLMPGSVNNVNEYLQAADIYIASSKSEGLPNGVLEAMAVGLPVILSDIEQHKEVHEVNPQIGSLYRIGDKNDCVAKIMEMDATKRAQCGQAAYCCAHEQFSAERMSRQYQAEYLRISQRGER